jgi:uncharacterized membrane protein
MGKNHSLWMIIGCALPLLLIFVLPFFGISGGGSLFIFIILMFACHLFMMGGHGGDGEHGEHGDTKEAGQSEHKDKKGAGHGCH